MGQDIFYLEALNNATKNTQNELFTDLNSYQQNVLLRQIQMNDTLKKSVIRFLFNENYSFKNQIN